MGEKHNLRAAGPAIQLQRGVGVVGQWPIESGNEAQCVQSPRGTIECQVWEGVLGGNLPVGYQR